MHGLIKDPASNGSRRSVLPAVEARSYRAPSLVDEVASRRRVLPNGAWVSGEAANRA